MEVQDVSNDSQFLEMLKRQRRILQDSKKREGERPKDRKSLGQLVQQHMMQYISREMMPQGNRIHLSWLAPPYPPSTAALKDLNRLFIKDLQLETHHRGFYLTLRVAAPPVAMTAIMAVFEDEKANGLMLYLYHQNDDKHHQAEDTIKVGGICIVKEPYFKVMSDGGYGVRIDHISDILWLAQEDERTPLVWQPQIREIFKDPMDLKQEGNAAMKAGKPYSAIACYTSAIECSAMIQDIRSLKLNRSQANLNIGSYDKALEDSLDLPAGTQQSEKGYYRATRSLYELRRFEECRAMLDHFTAQFPNSEEAKKEQLRVSHRLEEQVHGKYDFKAMYKAVEKIPPCLDNATYLGPVKIQTSEGHGRGLFTTRAVTAGELLLCEKAFSYCYADKEGVSSSKVKLLMNTHTKRMVMGAQPDLITATVQKMYRNPSLMPDFTSLHHGDYTPVNETQIDDAPIVDTFLVDRIISLNVFGCPRISFKHYFLSQKSKEKQESFHHSCGIFITASYINHSCFQNARRSFIGDMQIVRASRNIPANTEVCFWYAAPEAGRTWEKTQEKLRSWNFQCTCPICQEDKRTPKKLITKRTNLLADLKAACDSSTDVNVPRLERLLAAVGKTYKTPAAQVPRLALWDPYLLLTRLYASQNKPDKVVQTAWKVFDALGFVTQRSQHSFQVEQWGLMEDHVIETWVHLWTGYAHVAPGLCKKAEEHARIAYRIIIGEDETFDEVYGKVALEAMFKEGLATGEGVRAG